MLSQHFRGYRYNRMLMTDDGIHHVTEEYSRSQDIVYIVANYSSPNSVYNPSSVHDSMHVAIRARIDNYLDRPCTRIANGNDPYPWLQISLPNEYTIIGVYIKRRCDGLVHYPTVVDVMTSEDDVIWQEVVARENTAKRYSCNDGHGFVNMLFSPTQRNTRRFSYLIFYAMRA